MNVPSEGRHGRSKPAVDASSGKKAVVGGPFHIDEHVTLYQGDCEYVMRQQVVPESIDTCVTSPPYWNLRDYDHDGQIGQEETPQKYADRLVSVFREVRRVLKDSGTVWLNVGDAYNSVGYVPHRSGWQRRKQLCLVPFRVALALQDDGWWVRNVAVWYKSNALPSSVSDRLTNRWEPVFLLAKSAEYFFDLDAIRVKAKTDDTAERKRAGKGNGKASGKKELRQWLSSPRHRVNIDGLKTVKIRPDAPDPREVAAYLREARKKIGLSYDEMAGILGVGRWQVIHYFRLDKTGSRLPPYEMWLKLKELLKLDDRYEEVMQYIEKDNVLRNHPNGRNPGDVLSVALKPSSNAHFATMPVSLAHRLLKATLPAGGVALDPFSGAGSTGVAARLLGGRYVGIDLNEKYLGSSIPRLTNFKDEERSLKRGEEVVRILEDDDQGEMPEEGPEEDDLPLFQVNGNGRH
jgi:DNA modification methylase